jgi:hypothetical protein
MSSVINGRAIDRGSLKWGHLRSPARQRISVSEIMDRVSARIPGDIVSAQLYGSVYVLRLIDTKARLLRVRASAQSGEILSVEGR